MEMGRSGAETERCGWEKWIVLARCINAELGLRKRRGLLGYRNHSIWLAPKGHWYPHKEKKKKPLLPAAGRCEVRKRRTKRNEGKEEEREWNRKREAALYQFIQYLKMLGANLKMLQLIVLQYRWDMRREEKKSRRAEVKQKQRILHPSEMRKREWLMEKRAKWRLAVRPTESEKRRRGTGRKRETSLNTRVISVFTSCNYGNLSAASQGQL